MCTGVIADEMARRRPADTRNNRRAGKVHMKPAHTVVAGVAFVRPYQAPFTVR